MDHTGSPLRQQWRFLVPTSVEQGGYIRELAKDVRLRATSLNEGRTLGMDLCER